MNHDKRTAKYLNGSHLRTFEYKASPTETFLEHLAGYNLARWDQAELTRAHRNQLVLKRTAEHWFNLDIEYIREISANRRSVDRVIEQLNRDHGRKPHYAELIEIGSRTHRAIVQIRPERGVRLVLKERGLEDLKISFDIGEFPQQRDRAFTFLERTFGRKK